MIKLVGDTKTIDNQRPKAKDQRPSGATSYQLLTTNKKLWTMDSKKLKTIND